MHVVALIGSLRRDSYNRMTYNAVRELLPAGVTAEEGSIAGIPPYNDDVRAEHGYPGHVQRLRRQLFVADAVLFISPEYNYSIPGVLKNAIDWVSRPVTDQPFKDKPVAIMGASTGMIGTARMQHHLRQCMVFVEALVMPKPEVMITFADRKFDGQTGRLVDEQTRDVIARQLQALADWTERAGRHDGERAAA